MTRDSILAASAVIGDNGGFETPDGFAVDLRPRSAAFARSIDLVRASTGDPLVSSADLTVWGLGDRGLSVRANARWGVDLGADDLWPGTQPAVQLLEGYAEYTTPRLTGRLGRQHVTGRFGWTGFDGAALTLRSPRLGLELAGYGGWGLARSLDVPITSPSLNPLDDFQLPERHLTAGAALGWRTRRADVRAEYRREVDPSVDLFISERTALTAVLRASRASEPHGRHRVRPWRRDGGAAPSCSSATATPASTPTPVSAVPALLRALDDLGRLQPGLLHRDSTAPSRSR